MLHRHCLLVTVVAAFACNVRADVVFVDDDAPPGGDGLSWNTAYQFLQDALANAGAGSEIRVAQGLYLPDQDEAGNVTVGDRFATFQLVNGVSLMGGFAGIGQPDPDSRDAIVHETILSGDLLGDDCKEDYCIGDNSVHVVIGCDVSSTAVLDGVTVAAGNANSETFPHGQGGGLFVEDGSPTIIGCTFVGNFAARGAGMANLGGSPTVTNCTFRDNDANVNQCLGGGIVSSSGSMTVSNCTFFGNNAHAGGGIFIEQDDNSTVSSCTFFGNTAAAGGGMYNNGSVTVTNCTFALNWASSTSGMSNGGGSSVTVTNCTFSGNISFSERGAMHNSTTSSVTVTNCVLWNNTPLEFSGNGTPVVTYSNVAGGFPGTGNIDADPLFVDPDGPDDVPFTFDDNDYRLSPGSPCIDAGDNTAVPEDITTDLDGNPRFLEIPETPDSGNGTLPIVDMGAYESLGGGCLAVTSQEVVCHADGTTFTVNVQGLNACTGGTTQVTFTASGGAVGEELCFTALVNDGGFCCTTEICVTIPECTPAALPSDLNGDGIVGMVDFLALLAAWGPCDDCGTCPADFDGDCSVGILDLLMLLGNWG